MPEPDQEDEGCASDERADPRGGRNLCEDDLEVAAEPEGQRHGGAGDQPTSEAMDLLCVLTGFA